MKIKQKPELHKLSPIDISSKIQELIELHNVSLSKVASATGLSTESIRQIVNGTTKNPGIETLSKIAEAFSMSLFDLLEAKVITSQVSKKKIKIVDFLDLQKLNSGKELDEILNQSTESAEILYVDDSILDSDFFALIVNHSLAEKLTSSGMPMLHEKDLLIFSRTGDYATNSLVLAKCNENTLVLGILMEVEQKALWIKSVDIPQKQIVIKVNKNKIVGILHNVQFNKK